MALRPVHPAQTFLTELGERKKTVDQFLHETGQEFHTEFKSFMDKESTDLSPKAVQKFAQYFGTSPEFIYNLITNYNKSKQTS